jgi:hypothetical protein
MPILPKPGTKSEWTDGDVAKVEEPTVPKKDLGFVPDERPSPFFHNWLWYIHGQWIDYLESVTDAFIAFATGDAVVLDGLNGTFATLQAAHDDASVGPGSRIIILASDALDATVNITKAEILLEFRPDVTYSKGGGAPATNFTGISLGSSADGVRIVGGRFAGFNGSGDKAIELQSDTDFVKLRDMRFSSNTTSIDDGGSNVSSTGHHDE